MKIRDLEYGQTFMVDEAPVVADEAPVTVEKATLTVVPGVKHGIRDSAGRFAPR